MDCLLCKSATKAGSRHRLFSPANRHILSTLEVYVAEMNPPAGSTILHENAWLCRSCARSLERLRAMTEDIKKTEALIREQLDLHYRGNDELQCLPASSSSLSPLTTPTKRTVDEAALCHDTTPKRRRYDTPTRRTLQRMIPSASSPAVAVSFMLEALLLCNWLCHHS